MLLHTACTPHTPKAGIVPLTQGRLKTLLQPHSLQGGCPPQSTQVQSAEEGAAERERWTPPAPPRGQVHLDRGKGRRGLRLFLAKESGRGEDFSSSSGQQLQVWAVAGLMRFRDLEIPVQTSRSSPGPGPAPEGGCAPPQGARSPKILVHLAHSAGAPAAAGLPWGSRHTPAANVGIGKREEP